MWSGLPRCDTPIVNTHLHSLCFHARSTFPALLTNLLWTLWAFFFNRLCYLFNEIYTISFFFISEHFFGTSCEYISASFAPFMDELQQSSWDKAKTHFTDVLHYQQTPAFWVLGKTSSGNHFFPSANLAFETFSFKAAELSAVLLLVPQCKPHPALTHVD